MRLKLFREHDDFERIAAEGDADEANQLTPVRYGDIKVSQT